jgi:hypothetical protein
LKNNPDSSSEYCPGYRRLNFTSEILVVPGFGVASRLAKRFFAVVGLSSPNAL